MTTARQAAVEALLMVNEKSGYSTIIGDQIIRETELSSQDSAFFSALFYGVLERMITLDFCISAYSKLPLAKMSPAVREILRCGFYQLMYMDSVPDSAAVNEAVKLTKQNRVTSASGFVNGVLRGFLRDKKQLPTPKDKGEAMGLSLTYSCPKWLVERLIELYGKQETKGFLQCTLGRRPLFIRVNTTKISAPKLQALLEAQGVTARQDAILENCLYLEHTGSLAQLPAYQEGYFHVQDRSSQTCVDVLAPKPEEKILDVCAAPGGKTFTAAQYMEGSGTVISCDQTSMKMAGLMEMAHHLELKNIIPKVNDATKYNKEFTNFDRILCDVPCSGFGIMGRKPEIKYKNPKELEDLPEIQYKILEISAQYLKAGGTLVYSTCTLEKKENEEVVTAFLKKNSDFYPHPFLEESWYQTLLPQTHGGDGFFIARMKKR